jgi:hypothetical protein
MDNCPFCLHIVKGICNRDRKAFSDYAGMVYNKLLHRLNDITPKYTIQNILDKYMVMKIIARVNNK